MTLGEFMAWLDGYKASFVSGGPTVAQFVEIEKRLKTIVPSALPQVRGRTDPKPFRSWTDAQNIDLQNVRVGKISPAHDGDAYGGRFIGPDAGFDNDVSWKGGVDA